MGCVLAGGVSSMGREFVAAQSHWSRVEGGKLAEHWAVRDDLTAMLQLGSSCPAGLLESVLAARLWADHIAVRKLRDG